MSEKVAALSTAKTADRVDFLADLSHTMLKNKTPWNPKAFDKNDIKKLSDTMTAKKKNVDFCVSFDDKGVVHYFARVGTSDLRIDKDKIEISKISGSANRFRFLDWLRGYDVVTDAQINAIKERDPMD
jgi:hypothetical protein